MSRPYQHPDEQEKLSSPLDRRPQNTYPSGQPPSFKTNVNRAKTKKWVEAKSYSYEGDDWGDYDEEDEYGVEAAASQPPALQQQEPIMQAGRNFTSPAGGPSGQSRHRPPSFDAGDERRAFSAGFPSVPQQSPPQSTVPLHVDTTLPATNARDPNTSGSRQFSAGSFAPSNVSELSSLDPRHRSNYSPSAEPQPLHTHISPSSGPSTATPTAAPIAARLEQTPTPAGRPQSAGSTGSGTRVIRPADIYKRVAEEREKERRSLEQQRGTPDSTARRSSTESSGRGTQAVPAPEPSNMENMGSNRPTQIRPTLASLPERRSEYGNVNPIGGPTGISQHAGPSVQPPASPVVRRAGTNPPQLPQVGGESTFGDEFWESTLGTATDAVPAHDPTAVANAPSMVAGHPTHENESSDPLQRHNSTGFTSIVHQAFDQPVQSSAGGVFKHDSTRSVTDSSVSRSNTTGTSDISPIMSRVPSSATSNMKAKAVDARERTPAIEEEPSDLSMAKTRRASGQGLTSAHQVPRKPSPSPAQSRTGSAEIIPGYRRDLSTPSPSNNPARSPLVEESVQLPQSEVADIALTDPVKQANATQFQQPFAVHGREGAENPKPMLGAAEQPAQESVLEWNASLPASRSSAIKREESPSKGRVADLAGRFNDISNSRRGSVESWEVSSSRSSLRNAAGAVEEAGVVQGGPPARSDPIAHELLPRPPTERELSFRPKLPGQWESYATIANDAAQDEQAKGIAPGADADRGQSTPKTSELTSTSRERPSGSDGVEKSEEQSDAATGPLASLAAAGAAVGEAIKKFVGLDTAEDIPKAPQRPFGVLPPRPIAPDRAESSVSTVPPTPPAKDEQDDVPPPVPLKERSNGSEAGSVSSATAQSRPPVIARTSTDESAEGLESDRLRKEIVRSLSPAGPTSLSQQGLLESHHIPAGDNTNSAENRESSLLPQEYDSYWNEKEVAPVEILSSGLPQAAVDPSPSSHTAEGHLSTAPPIGANEAPAIRTAPPSAESARPRVFLPKRFSWERDHSSSLDVPTTGTGPISPPPPGPESQSRDLDSPLQGRASPGMKGLAEDNPQTSGEGLHVINAEPGDLPEPPHLQAEPQSNANEPSPPQPVTPTSPSKAMEASSLRELGADPGLPTFRDIVAHKSQQQRIAKFNSTRQSWIEHNMGVQTWLDHMLQTQPEYRNLASESMATPAHGSSPRHKTTTSISRVFTGTKHMPSPQPSAAEHAPTGSPITSSPSHSHKPSVGQGKELLQAAGALGGKGMKGAKGLFAKGKSKFRGSGGGGGNEKALPALPSTSGSDAYALERTTSTETGGSVKSSLSIRDAKRTSRSLSSFRRSRPSSVVVPNAAQSVPGAPTEPVPEFRDMGKSLPIPTNLGLTEQASTPNSRHGQQNTLSNPYVGMQRPLTPPVGLPRLGILPSPALDTFGSQEKTRDAATGQAVTQHEKIQSIIQDVPDPLAAEEEKTPTQASVSANLAIPQIMHVLQDESEKREDGTQTPAAGDNLATSHDNFLRSGISGRGRIVSMIHPGDETDGAMERVELNEPVSPIEPEDDRNDLQNGTDIANVPRTVPKADDLDQGYASTSSLQNTASKGVEISPQDRSRGSMDSWERDEPSTNPPSRPDSSAQFAAEATNDTQHQIYGAALDHAGVHLLSASDAGSAMDTDSRIGTAISASEDIDHSSRPVTASSKQHSSAAEEEAGVARVVSLSRDGGLILESPFLTGVPTQQSEKADIQAPTLEESKVAALDTDQSRNGHSSGERAEGFLERKVSIVNDRNDSPSEAVKSSNAAPSAELHSADSTVSSEGLGGNSRDVERAPSPPYKSATTTTSDGPPLGPHPEQQQLSEREPSSAGGLGTLSLLSVSSISNKDPPSPVEPIGDLPGEQAFGHAQLNPMTDAFQQRVYTPSHPGLERPMSFVPLPRDSSGRPPQEQIHLGGREAGNQIGLLQNVRQYSGSTQNSPPRMQAQPGVISKPPPVPPPFHPPAHVGPASTPQQGVGRPQQPYAPGQFIGGQAFGRGAMDPRLHSAEYQLPGIGPPPVDPPGSKRLTKGIWSNREGQQRMPPDTARINPQLVVPPPTIRQQSYQSMDSQSSPKDDKKKRSSGIMAAFKRPPSAGADSSLSNVSRDASSITGQAGDSPTRQQYLQSPAASVGAIPPSGNDDPPPQPRKDKEKDIKGKDKPSRLQRASTTQSAEPSKKKRFSTLGSIFGRSGTTGHAHSKKTKDAKPQPIQGQQERHGGTVFYRVPENPNASAFAAMRQYQTGHPQQGGLRPQQLSPGQPAVVPPPGGYYAPGNESQQPAGGQGLERHQSTPSTSFQHGHGAAGYAAMARQQAGQSRDRSTPATSNHRSQLHFGRQDSSSSSVLSPQVSASSPVSNGYRTGSAGGQSISPVSSRRDSNPQIVPQTQPGFRRISRHPRMGSIGEQHQERPWQVSLPDAHDDDDPRHMAQEIMRAASARWHGDSEGRPVIANQTQQQPSPNPHDQHIYVGSTPVNPVHQQQSQASPTGTIQQPQMQRSFPSQRQQQQISAQAPANPVYTFMPTGPPPQVVQPPKPSQGLQYQYQQYSPQQYQRHHHVPPHPLHVQQQYQDYYPPPQSPVYRQPSDAHPQIPPLFQAQIPILQPQPQHAGGNIRDYPIPSSQSNIGVALPQPQSPPSDPYGQQRRIEDPRQGYRSTSQNNGNGPPVPSKIGVQLPGGRIGVALPGLARKESERKERSLDEAAAAAANQAAVQNGQATSSSAVVAESAPNSAVEPRPSHTPSSPYGNQERPHPPPAATPAIAEPQRPAGEGAAAPAYTGASAGASHTRHASDHSDFVPVMKGASYPGDEWIPTWDGE